MNRLAAELAFAIQSLRRAPAFASFAIALLALGIGSTVAVYSLFHSIVLRPLPYTDAHQLVGLTSRNAARAQAMPALSASDFRDFETRATSYTRLAAYRPNFASYAPTGGETVQFVTALITEEFFDTLEIRPLHGRGPTADEFSISGPRVAVISHDAWRRHFAGDLGAIGRTVLIDDTPTTVVGVMPTEFREPEFVDVWLPFPVEAPENLARDSRFWTTIGRLKPGVSTAAAAAEAAVLAVNLAREYPSTNQGWTTDVRPLLDLRIGSLRSTFLLLLGAVGLVLLLACTNLAGLLLARGVSRLPAMAVRLALGATPATLARSILLESGLLALLGGLVGVAIATIGLPLLASQLPAGLVPRSHEIAVDGAARWITAGVSVLTGLVFGVLPAWQAWRTPVTALLMSGGRNAGTGRFASRAQDVLVIGQIALTLVVLASSALLARSLLALERTDPGFDPGQVLAVRLAPPQSRWETLPELAAYYERAIQAVRPLPGVISVAANSSAPLCGISLRYPLTVEGDTRPEAGADEAVFNAISADFFTTLRLPLIQGRTLRDSDLLGTVKVCVINRALARRLFGEADPIGRRVRVVPWLLSDYREIVGVVGDVRQDNLADPPPAQVYVPQSQSPFFFSTLLVRSASGSGMTRTVQAALQAIDPTTSFSIRSLEENIARTTTVPRLRAILLGIFGAVALALSALGLYANQAFAVRQRLREIGVRMALGASPARVLAEVLGRASRLTLAGIVFGLLVSLGLSHLLQGSLHGVLAADPWTLFALALGLPVAVLLACAHPAVVAARLDPARSLRAD